jgi:hypothetical protein
MCIFIRSKGICARSVYYGTRSVDTRKWRSSSFLVLGHWHGGGHYQAQDRVGDVYGLERVVHAKALQATGWRD